MAQFDDEVPEAPVAAEGDAPVSGFMDAAAMEDVPLMGEPFPVGTYHFRLDSYTESWFEPSVEDVEKYAGLARQPQFQLHWSCQQEPHTGRVYMDFMPWVTEECVKAAVGGNPLAKELVKKRLFAAKTLMLACGFKPVGAFDFKGDFLGANPEVRIQLSVREAKTRVDGKLQPTGEMRNRTVKYVSLQRPA